MYSSACLATALANAAAYTTLRVTPGDWVNATGGYVISVAGLVLEAEQSGVNDPSEDGGLVYLIGAGNGVYHLCVFECSARVCVWLQCDRL